MKDQLHYLNKTKHWQRSARRLSNSSVKLLQQNAMNYRFRIIAVHAKVNCQICRITSNLLKIISKDASNRINNIIIQPNQHN
jgi:hypothetical protein